LQLQAVPFQVEKEGQAVFTQAPLTTVNPGIHMQFVPFQAEFAEHLWQIPL